MNPLVVEPPPCDKTTVTTGYAPEALSYVTAVPLGVLKTARALLAKPFEAAIAEMMVATSNTFFIVLIRSVLIGWTAF